MDINLLKDKISSRQLNKIPHLTNEQILQNHLSYINYHKQVNEDEIYVIPIEEMSEHMQHLTKCIRNKESFDNDNIELLEELVDVQICLDNLKIAFDIDDELIKTITDIKFERIQNKIVAGNQ